MEETTDYCLLEKTPLDSTSLTAITTEFKHGKSGRSIKEGHCLQT